MPSAREGRDRRLLPGPIEAPGELERLTVACERLGFSQLRAAIEFAVATARRRGEILALSWTDVRKNSVLVRRSKTGRQRAMALSQTATLALDRVRWEQRNLDSAGHDGADPVFTAFTGPSGDRLLERQWYKVLAETSIEDLHFHDLLHEGISRLFELGLYVAGSHADVGPHHSDDAHALHASPRRSNRGEVSGCVSTGGSPCWPQRAAHLVEMNSPGLVAHNLKVLGSNPTPATNAREIVALYQVVRWVVDIPGFAVPTKSIA